MICYKDFRIVWKHNNPAKTTHCIVYDRKSANILKYGIAICSSKDAFKKETGRKVSLAKVMRKMGWDKQTRTEIWEVYHNRDGKTKKQGENKTLNYYYQLMCGDRQEGLFVSNVDYETTQMIVLAWWEHFAEVDFDEWFEDNCADLKFVPEGTVISRLFVEEINV